MLTSRQVGPAPTLPNQLVLVIGESWDDSRATLRTFAFDAERRAWVPALVEMPAVLGWAGMAWGDGGQWQGAGSGPAKREGDGRSPAGVFPITALFGEGQLVPAARLPYVKATSDLKCIDDPASCHYNRIVDQSRDAPDWHSCEDMLRPDGRYEIGAVVGYNCHPVVPGAGSCIFLHVWQGPGVPTAGCTALARENMLALARWLDGGLSPVLVQLPRAAYRQVREDWGLPAVAG